jgi:hypothetical protein
MKGFKIYLTIGTLIIVVYIIAQYFKPQPTDWGPTYLAEDKIPFGTYILRKQLNDIFPGTKVKAVQSTMYNTLKEKPTGSSNLLIIASNVNIDTLEYRQMIKYIKEGNNIFIAAFQIQGVLLDTLRLAIESDFNFKSKRKFPVNFVNPSLKREFDYYFDKGIAGQYFDKLDSTRAIVLGEQQQTKANFISYQFGKGALYILPNPQLFTNYSLLKADGRDYAAKALAYLPKADTLMWDEHFTRPDAQDSSMLRVFFAHDQLRWTYNLALIGLAIFVFYEIKRRQRVIPVIDTLKNTSVEFVHVVGRVYYQQRNNKDIVEKKIMYLMEYIRNKYRLKTTALSPEFEESLGRISGASADTLEVLFSTIHTLKTANVINDQQLIDLNKIMEQFYKQDQ